jgi:hypothetical protein
MEHESPHVTTLLAELRALAALPAAPLSQRQALATNVLALPAADLLDLLRREAAANPALELVEQRSPRRVPSPARAPRGNRAARARTPAPDVIISRECGVARQRGFAVQVAEAGRFSVRLRPGLAGDSRAALAEPERQPDERRVARARLCVALVHQRRELLARLTWCLIDRHWEVLQSGVDCLTPLPRASVAFRAGLHEVTLTRAIAGKHCQLPTGRVVPFSRFFLDDPTVAPAIRDLIRCETVPLTDEQLAEALLRRDIAVAAATVAVCRQRAGIPPHERRGRPAAPVVLLPAPPPVVAPAPAATVRRARARAPAPAATAAELAAARAAIQAAHAARVAADRLAAARADELLRDMLTAQEYEQLVKSDYLDVPSPGYPHRFYRIPARYGRVQLFEQGKAVCELCVVSTEALPHADVIVMHRLLIQGSEETYLSTANRLPVYVPLGQQPPDGQALFEQAMMGHGLIGGIAQPNPHP